MLMKYQRNVITRRALHAFHYFLAPCLFLTTGCNLGSKDTSPAAKAQTPAAEATADSSASVAPPIDAVQLDASGRLPAVDGSQLTNLTAAHITGLTAANITGLGKAAFMAPEDLVQLVSSKLPQPTPDVSKLSINASQVMGLGTASALAAGNVAQLDAKGRLGVGTAKPQAMLEVDFPDAESTSVILNGGEGTNANTILFRDGFWNKDSSSGYAFVRGIDTGSQGGGLIFGTTSNNSGPGGQPAERMRITENGSIGVNNSDPKEMVDVAGNVRAKAFIADDNLGYTPPGWTVSGQFRDTVSGNTIATRIYTSGMVGGCPTGWSCDFFSRDASVGYLLTSAVHTRTNIGDCPAGWTCDLYSRDASVGYLLTSVVHTRANMGDCPAGWTCDLYSRDASVGFMLASAYNYRSDRRLKKNIEDMKAEEIMDRLNRLRPVTFEWKDRKNGQGKKFGLIAQEVEEVWPEIVSTGTDSQKTKSIEYSSLIAPLISGFKTLFHRQTESETAIRELQAKNESLEREVSELKALVCQGHSDAAVCAKARETSSKGK